jgi:hypothetical protein
MKPPLFAAILATVIVATLTTTAAMTFTGRTFGTFSRTTAENRSAIDGHTRPASWPNLRFMRTFFRAPESDPKNTLKLPLPPSSPLTSQSAPSSDSSHVREAPSSSSSSSASSASSSSSPTSSASGSSAYIDWSKFRPRLSSVISLETNTSTGILPSSNLYDAQTDQRKKDEDEKENGGGLSNYLTSWWNGASPPTSGDHRSVPSASSATVAPSNLEPVELSSSSASASSSSYNDHKNMVNSASGSQLDVRPSIDPPYFYHNAASIASGAIKAFLCDKTMAIVRRDANVMLDCELFDLDKRKRVSQTVLVRQACLPVSWPTASVLRFAMPANDGR